MSEMSGMIATIYTNVIAFMLSAGLFALTFKLRMKDKNEKNLMLILLGDGMALSVLYIIEANISAHYLPLGKWWAMGAETLIEILLTFYALIWFVYVDYRIFHSADHLKRNLNILNTPLVISLVLSIINIFTGIMFSYADDLTYTETNLYILLDFVRLIYFFGSFVYLEWFKRKDKRLRYLSIKSFIIPLTVYVLMVYFFPDYATASLGAAIGVALMYVQNINYMCYQDSETGFFNMLYLKNIRGQIEKGEYELNSALIYNLDDGDRAKMAELIMAELPEESDTFRLGKDSIVTLAKVDDKGPLVMLAGDIEISFDEAGYDVEVSSLQRKKKESPLEFLDRVMEKAQ